MQISQPRISQHLKILRQVGLVTERREGQRRMCRFNHELFDKTMQQFDEFMLIPLSEIKGFEEEYIRLSQSSGDACERKRLKETLYIKKQNT